MILIEGSRVPVDDPTTHLELTMIHEVMILDNSGSRPCSFNMGQFHKNAFNFVFVANILIPAHFSELASTALYLFIIFAISVIIRYGRIRHGKNRMSHVFEFVFIMSSFALVVLSLVVARMFGG